MSEAQKTTEPTTLPAKMVRLFTEYPCVGEENRDFELIMPEKVSRKSYEIIVQQLEFRRKCMNQGFDNLLELLKMHFDATHAIEELAESTPSV